jgi:hypothetical protein
MRPSLHPYPFCWTTFLARSKPWLLYSREQPAVMSTAVMTKHLITVWRRESTKAAHSRFTHRYFPNRKRLKQRGRSELKSKGKSLGNRADSKISNETLMQRYFT